MATWWAQTMPSVTSLTNDLNQVSASASAGNADAVAVACQAIQRDVTTIDTGPPAPDDLARTILAQSMSDYLSGTAQCIGGNLRAAATLFSNGGVAFTQAFGRIRELDPSATE